MSSYGSIQFSISVSFIRIKCLLLEGGCIQIPHCVPCFLVQNLPCSLWLLQWLEPFVCSFDDCLCYRLSNCLCFCLYLVCCFENNCLHIFLVLHLIPCSVICLIWNNISDSFHGIFLLLAYRLLTKYTLCYNTYIQCLHTNVSLCVMWRELIGH